MKTAITKDLLKHLPAGPCEIYDAKFGGLVLRIRESGKASWAVVYGRGKRITLGRVDVLDPDEARTRAREVLVDASHGRDPMIARRKQRAGTLRDFLAAQYGQWATANRKTGDQTVTRITAAFGASVLSKPMSAITAFQLEQWRSQRRRAGVQDSTINRDLDALRGVLSKAVEWRLLTEHPMRDVRRAKTDTHGRLRYLSPAEETRLRAVLVARDEARAAGRRRFNAWRAERGYKTLPDFGTYPDHVHPMVILALNTGLRRGELFTLQWADVDLVACRLTVRGTTAKSGITRHIPLNTEAVRVLGEWQACSTSDHTLVFPGPAGEPMTTLKTAWLKVAKAAKLKAFTFHDLRHTFASKLVQAGVDLNTVRELLGHANITMTLRYSHLAPEHRAAAVEKLVSRGA